MVVTRRKNASAGSGVSGGTAKRAKNAVARSKSARTKNATTARTAATTITSAAALRTAVLSMKEDKYLNSKPDSEIQPLAPTTGLQQVSVCSFATTSNVVRGNSTVAMAYGGRSMSNLHMLRPFKSTDAASVQGNLIDGNSIVSSFARVQFTIQRAGFRQRSATTTPELEGLFYKSLPIRVRVIRVTPKLAYGVQTDIEPSTDLFIDQYGRGYGVSSTNNNFTMSDAEYAIVNNRLYTVLDDKKFTLDSPPYIAGPGQFPAITIAPDSRHSRRLQMDPQLGARKQAEIYYQTPNEATTFVADSGHRREYIFMHFWWLNDDGTPIASPPGGADSSVTNQDVKVHVRAISKFKDV